MKQQILKELLALTKQQQQALEQDDLDTFQELLSKRQEQIDAMDKLHSEHPETKEQKETKLVQELVTLEKKNNEMFQAKFQEVKQKLTKMRAQKKVNSLYSNVYSRAQEEGIFFDKK